MPDSNLIPSNDIPGKLRVPAQVVLDAKTKALSIAALMDLGEQDNLAYTYYKGLVVKVDTDLSQWEWREPFYLGEVGLLPIGYTYPDGLIVDGVDYSNTTYNFFPYIKAQTAFTKAVFVNGIDPNTATVFALDNPPIINDEALKADSSNLYIGVDSSTWVYNTINFTYTTHAVTTTGSNFFISGTNIDAGGIKTGSITKNGELVIDSGIVDISGFRLTNLITGAKVLKTDALGNVIKTTFLEDVQYLLPADIVGKEDKVNKGVPLGYTPLDSNNKVPLIHINDALLGNVNYQGLWNQTTNNPDLTVVAPKGHYYICSGLTETVRFGLTFNTGDWIISNGTTWDKVDNTDSVSSIFGRTGNVTALIGDYNTSLVPDTIDARYQTDLQKLYNDATSSIQAQLNSKTPLSRSLNINGNNYDLSTNREWRVAQADTGVLSYGGISTASTTTVNIGAVTGYIVNNETNSALPTYTYINYPGELNKTVTSIGTGTGTYVMLSASNTIVFQNTFPTSAERKSMIYLSKISHPNLTSISFALDEVDFITSPLAQFRDVFQAIQYIKGGITVTGNSGLTINNSNGKLTGDGINFVINKAIPNTVDIPSANPRNFLLLNQSGAVGSFVTTIDPINIDVAGVTTVIGGSTNRSSIQYLYYAPGVGFAIQRGQTIYDTLPDAIAAVGRESFIVRANLVNNSILIAAICLRHTTTDMNNLSFVRILPSDKFGQISGAAAGITIANLQTAYNNSPIPQIAVTDLLGALTIKNARALNTSNIQEWQNIAGVTTASINGNGAFIGTSWNGYTPANDANVIHKTGNEAGLTGIKEWINTGTSLINGFNLINNGIGGSSVLNITNTGGGTGIDSRNNSNGYGIYSLNVSTGNGLFSVNTNTGQGIKANNQGSGIGIYSLNQGVGNGIVSNQSNLGTGFNFVGQNDGVNTFIVDKLGNITGNSFIKSGGTASQYLMANGSVSTLTNPVTGTGTIGTLSKFITGGSIGDSMLTEGSGIITATSSLDQVPLRIVSSIFYNEASIGFQSLTSTSSYYVRVGAKGEDLVCSTNNLERLRILQNGNVGIGTVNPFTKLHLQGNIADDNAITHFLSAVAVAKVGINAAGGYYIGVDGDTGATERFTIGSSTGIVKINNLAGTGIRMVTVDDSGNLSYATIGGIDTTALHKTGNESFTGIKSATNTGTTTTNGLNLINNATTLFGASIAISNNAGGSGIYSTNTSTGNNIYSNNTSTGLGISSDNNSTGTGINSVNYVGGIGIYSNNAATGQGIYSNNASTGLGIYSNNASTGTGILSYNTLSGNGIVSNGTAASTGFIYVGQNNTINTFTVDKFGNIICNTIKTTGFLVSALPVSQPTGTRAYVTDALTPVFLNTVSGGGSVICPVFYNGTNWVVS